MRAWIDRTNGGLSEMPADGISLPQKGDFGTSRWAARKLSYINHAPSRTGRLGSIYADEPAHRTPELARKACPVVERQRTAVRRWIARDRIVLVDAARDRIIFQFADRELLRRANDSLGAHALAQGIAAHERCPGDVSDAKGITRALTSLRKERLNMCRPMKTAIPGFLP